jgi:phenylalanyl-tRNA synthetase beta chain
MMPAREREMDFSSPVYLAELDLPKLRKLLAGNRRAADLPQFPGSSRDAAMEVPIGMAAAEIENTVIGCREPLLVDFGCFDLFTDPSGNKLGVDRKSIAYRFHYRADDRTLTSAEVDVAHQGLLKILQDKLGVRFR